MKILGLEIRRTPSKTVPNPPTSRRSLSVQGNSHPSSTSSSVGYFEALAHDEDRSPLPMGISSLSNYLNSANRRRIGAISRWLYDNHPLVGYAVDLLKLYSSPIYPQSIVEDIETANEYEAYFRDWSRRAEFTGRFNFSQIQELASIAIDTDGDLGILATTENGFLQLQLVDSGLILSKEEDPLNFTEPKPPENLDGVKVDRKGRVRGYSIAQPNNKFRLYPAGMLYLVQEPDRSSRYRGFSPLRRGANDMRDGSDIKRFIKLGVKFDNAIVAAIKNTLGEGDEDDWGDDAGNQPTNEASKHEQRIALADLLGGQIPYLPDGTELQQLNTNRPEKNVTDFIHLLAGHMVQGLGLPAGFFLDDRVTGPNQRAINSKAQRRFDQRQATLARLVNWAWIRVIGTAIDNGELRPARNWYKCEFQFPPRLTIDSGRESAQEREDVSKGLMTRREHYGNRGKDWQKETDQVFAELDYMAQRAKILGDKHGISPEAIFSGMVTPTSAGGGSSSDNNNQTGNDDE